MTCILSLDTFHPNACSITGSNLIYQLVICRTVSQREFWKCRESVQTGHSTSFFFSELKWLISSLSLSKRFSITAPWLSKTWCWQKSLCLSHSVQNAAVLDIYHGYQFSMRPTWEMDACNFLHFFPSRTRFDERVLSRNKILYISVVEKAKWMKEKERERGPPSLGFS